MLRTAWRAISLRPARSCGLRTYSSSSIGKQHDPLNILFCGADEFSIKSLRALREIKDARPDKIAAIDVVCRPDKRVGRGLKQIHEVPIKSVATQLGLPLHQIDTFKGWSPPLSINLIIAVSFGLLVPARILNSAKYGGLNVHPSLLPDLRGPAPIVHTLLKRRSHTGVTLQTMHPTRFDHGVILAQTPAPGIPVPLGCTPNQLLEELGPLGADMLSRGIEDNLFLPPIKDIREGLPEAAHAEHAPKITPEDRHLDWQKWTADEIIRRDRILGRLWDNQTYSSFFKGRFPKRITFHGPWTGANVQTLPPDAMESYMPGQSMLIHHDEPKDNRLGIRTMDKQVVVPSAATVEGEPRGKGLLSMIDRLRGH